MESQNNKLVLDTLAQHYDILGQEIREKMELRAALGVTRAYLEGLSSCGTGLSIQILDHIPETGPGKQAEDPRIDLTGLSVDFTGSPNVLERLFRIGEADDNKLLNSTKGARFLIDAGVSSGKLDSIRRNVDDALTNNAQHFKRVAPGTFKFLGRNPPPSPQPSEDLIQDENYPT